MSARACGRGSARFRSRRLRLSSKFVAAIYDRRYSQPPTVATKSARYWACWVASPVIVLFIVSCTNLVVPPEVSPALVANAHADHADANVLATGRKLFVSRCLECHTLPSVTEHSREEWPHLVNRMAGRANLSASEQAAIVAYLRAASLTGAVRP